MYFFYKSAPYFAFHVYDGGYRIVFTETHPNISF